MFAWGRNVEGQCAQDRELRSLHLPQQVVVKLNNYRCTVIAAGGQYSCAGTACGKLFEWGRVYQASHTKDPRPVLPSMLDLSDGSRKVLQQKQREMLEESERLYLNKPSASGESVQRRVFRVSVYAPTAAVLQKVVVKDVAVGQAHVLVLSANGEIFSKGYNDHGQLGNNTRESREHFGIISFPEPGEMVWGIAAGNEHSAVLRTRYCSTVLYTFGSNRFGQLGHDMNRESVLQPDLVQSLASFTTWSVAAGDFYTMVLASNGSRIYWGYPGYAQHGSGNDPNDQELMGIGPIGKFEFTCIEPLSGGGMITYISFGSQFDLLVNILGFLYKTKWTGRAKAKAKIKISGHLSFAGPPMYVQRIESMMHLSVYSVASGNNHTLMLVERQGSLYAQRYASLLGLSDDTVITCKPSFVVPSPNEIPVLSWMIFSRCPRLRDFCRKTPQEGKIVVQLPFFVQNSVLAALVEYLYCDHIRSCPVNRMHDLESLGSRLSLPHLRTVASSAKHRSRGRPDDILERTTFSSNMIALLQNGLDADVNIQLGSLAQGKEINMSEVSLSPVDLSLESRQYIERFQNLKLFTRYLQQVKAHLHILKLYPYFCKLVSDHFNGHARVQDGKTLAHHNISHSQTNIKPSCRRGVHLRRGLHRCSQAPALHILRIKRRNR